jgi:hypothetical protein
MDQTDQRPADPGRDELRTRLDFLTSRIDAISKDYQQKNRELLQALDAARSRAIVRTVGAVLTAFLFACTFGTWLTFTSDKLPDRDVDAWDIPSFTGDGWLTWCLGLLVVTVLLGMLAATTVSFGGCLAAAIGGVALFAAEIALQLDFDGQIARGNLPTPFSSDASFSDSTSAHLGSGYPFLYVVTIGFVIWSVGAVVTARRAADRAYSGR